MWSLVDELTIWSPVQSKTGYFQKYRQQLTLSQHTLDKHRQLLKARQLIYSLTCIVNFTFLVNQCNILSDILFLMRFVKSIYGKSSSNHTFIKKSLSKYFSELICTYANFPILVNLAGNCQLYNISLRIPRSVGNIIGRWF